MIYTDGAYDLLSKRGGWAFAVVRNTSLPEVHYGPLLASEVDVLSGSSAEIMAAQKALSWISEQCFPENTRVDIRPDYATLFPLLAKQATPKSNIALVNETGNLL